MSLKKSTNPFYVLLIPAGAGVRRHGVRLRLHGLQEVNATHAARHAPSKRGTRSFDMAATTTATRLCCGELAVLGVLTVGRDWRPISWWTSRRGLARD